MKTSPFLAFAVAFISAGIAIGQEPTPPGNEAKELREEVQRVEAELARLNLQLTQLKERLAKIEGQQPRANQPSPPLRFSIGIERAMMGEAIPRPASPPQIESEIFENKKTGPQPFGPVIPPRK